MSYHIKGEFKTTGAWMYARDIVTIAKKHGDDLPEANFIDEKREAATDAFFEDRDAKIPLVAGDRFWWSGNHAREPFLEYVAPKIMGHLEVIWFGEEGGDCGGAIVDDGKVTKCRVEMRLVPEGT